MMKKLFMVVALLSLSVGLRAQDAAPAQKYSVATNSFWNNWFVQLGGDWNAWYSTEEYSSGQHNSLGLLSSGRRTFGGALAIGKWFTPGLGIRTKLQAWQGRAVPLIDNDPEKFDEWILNEHIMFNFSNMFLGYNPTRVWNIVPFIGGGISRNMSDNRYAIQMSLGMLSTWRLGSRVNIYLEAGWNQMEDDFDGVRADNAHKSRFWKSHDNNVYGEIGLMLRLGKSTWKPMPDVDAIRMLSESQIDALNAQLEDANAENERLRNLLEEQPKVTETTAVAPEIVNSSVSVFFDINNSEIASHKDLFNVKALAKYAKENGKKLIVTGYADSATGNMESNQQLSEARANTVADELLKMGMFQDNIIVVGKGGINELSPISYNRRVIVSVGQ